MASFGGDDVLVELDDALRAKIDAQSASFAIGVVYFDFRHGPTFP